MEKKFFLLFLVVFTIFTLVHAENKTDSSDSDDKWDWHKFEEEMDFWEGKHSSPTITLTYGVSDINLKGFSGNFKDAKMPEIKLGYSSEKPFEHSENILKYKYRYFFLTNFSTDLFENSSSVLNELESDIWRFGFARAAGYGYKFGESAILPYSGYSFGWSRLNVKEMPLSENDLQRINMFNETFRFGTSSEGGIRFRIIPAITLEAGYERSAIFQRHLFWKWAGSVVIEAASHGILDSFISVIAESSPGAAPVVNFILKNALSYGIYELRQEKMNWPFNSEAPLSLDQFKVGVTFNF